VDVVASNIAGGTATITVTYSESELAGISETTLTLYYYTGSTWTILSDVTRDTAANTVTGSIDVRRLNGTIIALTGQALQLGALTLNLGGQTVTVDERDSVTFIVTATFTDGTPASSTAVILLRNTVRVSTATTGADGTASITLTFDQPGTFTVAAIGQLAGIEKTSSSSTVVVLLKRVTAFLNVDKTTLQPGSSVKVTLSLNSTRLLAEGTITITLPQGFTARDVTTTGIVATATIGNNVLTIQKTPQTASATAATISFTLIAPVTGLKVDERVTVSASVNIAGLPTVFATDSSLRITIAKPTVQSIFSVLDSYFANQASQFTEGRVPTVADIFALLDLLFGA
jgi:hypothetical protein